MYCAVRKKYIQQEPGINSYNWQSGWKWSHTDKYRYQGKRFELIGYHSSSGRNCEYWTDFDFNLTTSRIEVKKEYEKCEDEGTTVIYKRENEKFTYKMKTRVFLEDRLAGELQIISPEYKHELYL